MSHPVSPVLTQPYVSFSLKGVLDNPLFGYPKSQHEFAIMVRNAQILPGFRIVVRQKNNDIYTNTKYLEPATHYAKIKTPTLSVEEFFNAIKFTSGIAMFILVFKVILVLRHFKGIASYV